ncbi:Nuclear envelope morphology protein 1 [Teratosphaeriaceae sp. CCFEE 6253]|nr:Nuclear envelope morphology protein 1 [Teratosphaeriaceae sp. CCFEE 6253]
MNSLNIVSRLTTTPPPSPPRSRTSSSAHPEAEDSEKSRSAQSGGSSLDLGSVAEQLDGAEHEGEDAPGRMADETTPLLRGSSSDPQQAQQKSRLWQIPKRVAHAVLYGATVVFTTIAAPGRYVIACFYDNEGHFSAILPLKNFKSLLSRRKRQSTAQAVNLGSAPEVREEKERPKPHHRASKRRTPAADTTDSATSPLTSEDEKASDSPAQHTRSQTATAAANPAPSTDEIAPHKKAGRIKLLPNDEALRKRKLARAAQRKQQAAAAATNPEDLAATLKSPSSPTANASKLTRYPRAPAPPRPLVPRRQPSYTLSYSPETPKKTLIIDLDETLIHSMAKGGRMSTGHMVEVRLGGALASSTASYPTTSSSAGGGSSGIQLTPPGVPILYYVHERPHCHDFLRKMAKWYTLVVFTASVQEYADPVVDWLERERKYFSGRYYRQHCTWRNGAYIKDLAQVEPDLSRVMILDNSPMSYIFHEDNAIPIEGWISDPTDRELLHLVPLLESLQYVTDVRALLALRQGQAPQA